MKVKHYLDYLKEEQRKYPLACDYIEGRKLFLYGQRRIQYISKKDLADLPLKRIINIDDLI